MFLEHAFDHSEPPALLMPLLDAAILVLAYLLSSSLKRSGHVAYDIGRPNTSDRAGPSLLFLELLRYVHLLNFL